MYTNNLTASGMATMATVTTAITDQPIKLPEVQAEVERLGYGLEALGKLVDHLESRLSPVLAQREVSNSAGSNQPEPVRVPLADVLHQRVLVIDALCRQLQSISERVEL